MDPKNIVHEVKKNKDESEDQDAEDAKEELVNPQIAAVGEDILAVLEDHGVDTGSISQIAFEKGGGRISFEVGAFPSDLSPEIVENDLESLTAAGSFRVHFSDRDGSLMITTDNF